MPPSSGNSTNPADNTSASDIGPKPKRVAVRATKAQLKELTRVFADSPRPTRETKDALAARTGLTTTWVSHWFMRKNRKKPLEFLKHDSRRGNGELTRNADTLQSRHPSVTSNSPLYTSTPTDSSSFSPISHSASSILPDWSAANVSLAAPSFTYLPPLGLSVSTARMVNSSLLEKHMRFLLSGAPRNVNPAQIALMQSFVSTTAIVPTPVVSLTSALHVPDTTVGSSASVLPTPAPYFPYTSRFDSAPPHPHPPKLCFKASPSAPRTSARETRANEDTSDAKVDPDAQGDSDPACVQRTLDGAQDTVSVAGSKTEEETTQYLSATVTGPSCALGMAYGELASRSEDRTTTGCTGNWFELENRT